jgi:hypothetical protein
MQEPERRTETLEGVGVVETVVFYEEGLAKVVAEASSIPAPPSRAAVLGFDLRMLFRSIAELLKGKASGKVPAA